MSHSAGYTHVSVGGISQPKPRFEAQQQCQVDSLGSMRTLVVVHIAKGAQQVHAAAQRAGGQAPLHTRAAGRPNSRDCWAALGCFTCQPVLLQGGSRCLVTVQRIGAAGARQQAGAAAAAGMLQRSALLAANEQQAGAAVARQ